MLNKYLALFLLALIISAFSQVLLKISANKEYKIGIQEYLNRYVISAYILFLCCIFLTSLAYKSLQLKQGAVLEAFGYVFILMMDWIFFNQKISKNKFWGSGIIIIGIVIFFS